MKAHTKKTPDPKEIKIYLAILIFLLAFSIRMIYLVEVQKSPLFDAPIMDAKYHSEWAQKILVGEQLDEGAFFRAPLYFYFLAGVYAIWGVDYFWIRIIQFIIGSLSCVLIFIIASKVFNQTVGLISGLIASSYGVFIYFEGELLIPVLIVFLNLLFIWSLLFLTEKPNFKRSLLSGMLLGLSAIARPNILLVAVALFFWIIFLLKSNYGYKKGIAYAFSFALGIILVISPVTLRNYVKAHDLVLISSQGGVNFYIGNNPRSDGIWANLPEVGATWEDTYEGAYQYAQDFMGKKLKASEVSQFWFRKSLEFIRKQPGNFLGLMFKKFLYFWDGKELPNNKDLYFFIRFSNLLKILIWKKILFFPFGIIGPLSIMGMILSFKKTNKVIPLMIFVFVYMITVILFFVNSRYRVPVIPFLIIFASCFVHWLYLQLKKRELSSLILPVSGLLILTIVINSNTFVPINVGSSFSHNKLGLAYIRKGKLPEAVEQFELALKYKPDNTAARINLGTTFTRMARYDRAIDELQTALRLEGEKDIVHYELGLIYQQIGEHEKAVEHYNASISFNPRNPLAHNNLGSIYVKLEQYEKAVEEFKITLQYSPSSYRPHFNLGIVYSKQHKYQEAIEEFLTSIDLQNDYSDSYYNLGIIYKKLGMKNQAISSFRNFLRVQRVKNQYTEIVEKTLKELEAEK